MENCKYGLLGYNSINIGDEIQSVAQSRFLPTIDDVVYREQVKNYISESEEKIKLIMNAWWMWRPNNFPPSKFIDPLLISMHIRPRIRKEFLTKETKEYFLEHGPVGCRDIDTCDWLKQEGVPAYFSGCLTLTLQRNYEIPRQNYILCVDVKENIVKEIRKRTKMPVYSMGRRLSPFYNSKQRFELAKLMLRLYHDAHLVISPRLHVILPALALETPVLRIKSKVFNVIGDSSRYAGFEDFCHSVNLDNGFGALDEYDFDNPLPNPNKHLEMREDLIKRCSEFTGYDNSESLIENEPYPFIKLLKLNVYSYSNVRRLLYFATEADLKTVLKHKKKGIDKFSLVNDVPVIKDKKMGSKFNLFRCIVLEKLLWGDKKKHYAKKIKNIKMELSLKSTQK